MNEQRPGKEVPTCTHTVVIEPHKASLGYSKRVKADKSLVSMVECEAEICLDSFCVSSLC